MSLSGLDVVAEVEKMLGIPYVYGAEGPSADDCSGLAQYVYKQLGVAIPRTSSEQFKAGTPVDPAQAQPGDLVFFGGGLYDGTPSQPGHVGIYIGNGQMINAPHTGTVVRVDSTAGNVGFRRFGTDTATLTSTTGGAQTGIGGDIGNAISSAAGGLFSIPTEIVQAFVDVDKLVAGAYDGLKLFFEPSTYVRIGAGLFGTGFVITGLVFLMREARNG